MIKFIDDSCGICFVCNDYHPSNAMYDNSEYHRCSENEIDFFGLQHNICINFVKSKENIDVYVSKESIKNYNYERKFLFKQHMNFSSIKEIIDYKNKIIKNIIFE